MKKYALFLLICSPIFALAKPLPPKPSFRPDWCFQLPVPENATYVYTREQGEGATKQEALNKAYCQVLETTAQRLGQTVNTADIHNAVYSGTDYEVVSRAMKIPVNKVCDFYKQDPKTHRWTAYILCQVAEKGYVTPEFEPCSICLKDSIFKNLLNHYNQAVADSIKSAKRAQKKEDGLALVESLFVPGLGQMMKASKYGNQKWMIEGGVTLGGEIVLWSIGAGLYLGGKKQEARSNSWGIDYQTYQNAISQKKALYGTSYAFFALAVAMHGLNMYRAFTMREGQKIAFYPQIIPTSDYNVALGVGTTIKF